MLWVVAELLRLCGHGEHDDSSYIDPKLKASRLGRDCLKVAEEELIRQGWAEPETVAAWRAESVQRVDEAIATVSRESPPDPYAENWCALFSRHLSEGHEL